MFKKLLLAIFLYSSAIAFAFTPPKLVTVTVGFAPGSGNEISFRAVAAAIEKTSDIRFVIMNKPGADEIIALDQFGKLDPTKGDNLYIISQNNLATQEEWYPGRLKYSIADMPAVTNIAKSPLSIVAHSSSKTSTPTELLDRIKNTKTPITFALGSNGQRLVFEYMMDKSGGNSDLVKSIVYRGPANALQDVAGNQVEFAVLPTAIATPMVKSGLIKFIGITSEHKLPQLPNVPLMKDYVKGLNFYASWGISLPVGSTPEQVKYYNELFVPVIRSPEVQKFFEANMMLTFPNEHISEAVHKNILQVREQWAPFARKFKLE
jgi:tripartite-type tricarboxylate transporter receptor subunit TctC